MITKYRFLSPTINAIAALAVSASAMAGDVYTDSATDLPAGGNNLLNILSVDVSYTSTHIKFSFTLDGISNQFNMNQYAFALSTPGAATKSTAVWAHQANFASNGGMNYVVKADPNYGGRTFFQSYGAGGWSNPGENQNSVLSTNYDTNTMDIYVLRSAIGMEAGGTFFFDVWAIARDNSVFDALSTNATLSGYSSNFTTNNALTYTVGFPPVPTLSLTASDSTLQTGQSFTVDVAMNATSALPTGLQLAMNYDQTKLRLDSVAPATNSPFATEIAEQINNTNGTLRYAVGVDESQTANSAAAKLVTLSFTALTNETCGTASLISFGTVSGTTTKFTLADGIPLAPNLGTFASIKIDGTAPVLNNLPANVSATTDAGSTFGAYVANPGVTVSDNCDTLTPTLLVTYPDSSTASAWPANGMFPIGTTTLAWSVTDQSGNFASASRTIVVANYQLVDATMSFDGPFVTASTRSIRFTAGSSTQLLSLSASGSPLAGGSINAIQVPVAASYTCLRAKDPTHSVTDTASATVSGVRYQAAFSLKQGDSNDDDVVDILDFGIFVAGYGAGKALDATSNFNSDTIIANADFAFISINFFNVGEACGAYTGATPRDRMTVKELRRSGRGGLAIADINGDGWVDTTDITLFMQGVAPRKPAEPARAAAPDAVNW
ncbi:MAG: cohesin domain-containing protein [Planctomycetota bacterium]